MKAYVGVTDGDWFTFLSGQPHLEEINFWQPGGSRSFLALQPGELFLFKLHSPRNFIVGGGIFAHSSLLPVSLAWESFGNANGVSSLGQMRARIEYYRRRPGDRREDYTIGCIVLTQPFFLPEDKWIATPHDWKSNIVQGRTYDLTVEPGLTLYRALEAVLALRTGTDESRDSPIPVGDRYGTPVLIAPRLGQGAFRVVVTDAYSRRCAISGERVLPVLEAAHIRPYGDGGPHQVENGLLLRSDLHTLFDRGYLTVTPKLQIEVSPRLREEFENGRDYYALHGHEIRPPASKRMQPAPDNLVWHNEHVFRA